MIPVDPFKPAEIPRAHERTTPVCPLCHAAAYEPRDPTTAEYLVECSSCHVLYVARFFREQHG